MNNEIIYICKKCGENFCVPSNEEVKCPSCNAENEDIDMSVTRKDFEKMIEFENQEFTCKNCLSSFNGIQLSQNDFKCPHCKKEYNLNDTLEKIEKRYACNSCNCKFSKEVFFKYNGACPNCHDNLMSIEQWEDYKAVELDGEIPDEDWQNL